MVEKKRKRILVSAGDPSGDLILSRVVLEWKKANPEVEFVGLCGPESEKAGVRLLARSSDVAVVGITEVLFNLKKIFSTLAKLGNELAQCDSLLCVDFPDFNLKLAEMAQKKGVPVDYIVAPQVWAWRAERIHKIKRLVRRLYVVLPFEENFFKDRGVNAKFIGHPIRDLLPPKNRRGGREELGILDGEFVLVWMPGSRKNEIKIQLPMMRDAYEWLLAHSDRFLFKEPIPKWRIVLPLAPGWDWERVKGAVDTATAKKLDLLIQNKKLVVTTNSRAALSAADFAWITSGTATLEAALYQVPHILVYRLSGISERLIRASSHYFSQPDAAAGLPNILLGKKVIPELLQSDLSAERLAIETGEILGSTATLFEMKRPLRFLPKLLGETGACARIAMDLEKSL